MQINIKVPKKLALLLLMEMADMSKVSERESQ